MFSFSVHMYFLYFVYFVSLLLLPLTQSQEVIDGTWTDDFLHDPDETDGWNFWNEWSLGNPIVQGQAIQYHGPFQKQGDSKENLMTRRFSCKRDSTLFFSFNYGYCIEGDGGTDWIKLIINDNILSQHYLENGRNLENIETQNTFNNLPRDCAKIQNWEYRNATQNTTFWKKDLSMRIQFKIKMAGKDKYSVVFNVSVTCVALPTAQPTPEPTIYPTRNPSISPSAAPTFSPSTAPTLAPSIAPSYRPGAPTNAPTFTQKYVSVRTAGLPKSRHGLHFCMYSSKSTNWRYCIW
eukprot:1012418_1